MSQGMGQRRFERFNIFERATLVNGKGEQMAVILIDVSLGGAQVLSKGTWPDNTDAQLVVGSGNDQVSLTGQVRYCRPGEHDLISVGFRFMPVDGDERVQVANLINRIFMNPSELSAQPNAAIFNEWLGKSAA